MAAEQEEAYRLATSKQPKKMDEERKVGRGRGVACLCML
jgi:hypothetical protein